jgi:cytidine deaminase
MNSGYKNIAIAAKKNKSKAYAPFSKFRVGAALLTTNNEIYNGCNIENSSYSLTVCAERVAVFNAISCGAVKFKAIAIASDAIGFTPPCGACRQVLLDLAGNIDIVLVDSKNKIKVIKLKSLLPHAFNRNYLR